MSDEWLTEEDRRLMDEHGRYLSSTRQWAERAGLPAWKGRAYYLELRLKEAVERAAGRDSAGGAMMLVELRKCGGVMEPESRVWVNTANVLYIQALELPSPADYAQWHWRWAWERGARTGIVMRDTALGVTEDAATVTRRMEGR